MVAPTQSNASEKRAPIGSGDPMKAPQTVGAH